MAEKSVKLVVDGKTHSGFVVSSLDTTPILLWFVVESEELKKQIGEQVTFIFSGGELRPENSELASRHKELFNQMQKAVHQHLFAH